MKKKCLIYLSTLLIIMGFVSTNASAAYIESLKYQWDEVKNGNNTYIENIKYKDIIFTNGFTYTDSKKDITPWYQAALSIYTYRYTRTYRTY